MKVSISPIMNSSAALALAAAVLAVFLLLPLPAIAQSNAQWNALYDRIIRLEANVQAMNSGAGGAVPGDAGHRISTMEAQLRQLVGEVQRLGRQMQVMQDQMQRLQEARGQQGSLSQPSNTQIAGGGTTQLNDAQVIDGFDSSAFPGTGGNLPQALPQGTQVLGQIRIQEDGSIAASDGVQTGALPDTVESASLDSPATGSSGGGAPKQLYDKAYSNLLGRRLGLAEAGFKTFTSRYRKHKLASNAHYWLGETYYAQGRYKRAAQSFLTGYKRYPRGRKAPDSLLKLGLSLQRLGQKKQACGAFKEVQRKYSRSKTPAKIAAREIKRAGC